MADIADILASVSRPTIPPRTQDLQALTRAWVNERSAPDLLPYPTPLIDRVMDGIKRQIATIEATTTTPTPSANFATVILQTELERFKFLLRSYLRARLQKLTTYPTYHVVHADAAANLSPLETQYLARHNALLGAHYGAAFLGAFPAGLRGLEDRTAGGSAGMVDEPGREGAVFVRVLREVGEVAVAGVEGRGLVELRRGDVWVLRWGEVRRGVEAGDLELV